MDLHMYIPNKVYVFANMKIQQTTKNKSVKLLLMQAKLSNKNYNNKNCEMTN